MNAEALAIAMQHDPKDPGKFEGETMATVYFYECSLSGCADEVLSFTDPEEAVYRVTAEEAAALDLDPSTPYFWLTFLDNGFVLGTEITEEQFEHQKARAEREAETENCA